eukprot:4352683-Pleurochrysis_carterae.AAC.1
MGAVRMCACNGYASMLTCARRLGRGRGEVRRRDVRWIREVKTRKREYESEKPGRKGVDE